MAQTRDESRPRAAGTSGPRTHRQPEGPVRARSRATLERDAALARVRHARGWAIAAAAALTVAVAVLVSAIAPGKSFAKAARRSIRLEALYAHIPLPPLPPVANPYSLGLQAPGGPPSPAPSNHAATQPTPAQQAAYQQALQQAAQQAQQAQQQAAVQAQQQAAAAGPVVVSGGS